MAKKSKKIDDSQVPDSITRRQFFSRVAGGALVITGIAGLKSNLLEHNSFPVRQSGYGSSDYGSKPDEGSSLNKRK